jgi:hypothetical protein
MRALFPCVGVAAAFLTPAAHGTGLPAPAPLPAQLAMTAHATVVGKVTEIEKGPVEAKPHMGFPTDPKVPYTIAVVKIDEPLIGAKGATQVRVGFSDVARGTMDRKVAPLGGAWPAIARLAVGQEGCFFLARHPSADFYTLYGDSVSKSDKDYELVMAEVRVVAKTIADPVAGLKSKAREDRFLAAATMLAKARRSTPDGSMDPDVEDMTAEESKLVMGVLGEMPWTLPLFPARPTGRVWAPSLTRQLLWPHDEMNRSGFEYPQAPATPRGVSPPDMTKERDEATAAYLKDHQDRVRLKKMVRPK